MDHKSYVNPERDGWDAFKALPRDEPIHMLNLVRFRPSAAYPDGHENAGQALSGADAYRLYAETSAPVLDEIGGSVSWSGAMQAMVIGPQDEVWDVVFIAVYPNSAAFMAMVKHPIYQKAVIHRQAAVSTSRLIRCSPLGARASFG